MALSVHSQDAKSKGQVEIFFLHFFFALVMMAILLLTIQLIGGALTWDNYSKYYIILIPITVVLPLIIAVTTAFSYKKVILTISPLANLNQEKLKEFFFKEDYMAVKQADGKVVFERARLLPRFLSLNFDKPYIEITPTEAKVYMLKRLSLVLIPQIQMGKRFEINPDQHNA